MTTTETPRLLDPTVETWALEFPGRLSEEALHYLREGLATQMPGKRVVVVQDGGRFRSLSSLDAAWAEAEAALPEGWRVSTLMIDTDETTWLAEAEAHPFDPTLAVTTTYAAGPTPAAALLALAEALRKPAPL